MTPGPWRTAAASVLGTSHAKLGTPCQDAHACEVLAAADGAVVLVAVVADGAGSAARSDEGARLACDLVVDEVRALCELGRSVAELSRDTIADWLVRFQSEVAVRAEAEGTTSRDFACTLVAAVVGTEHAAFFQVGDGAMVVSENGGEEISWIFWPDQGEYENLTFFATDRQAADRLQFDLCERSLDELVLFSDGLQRLALHYATRTAHAPFFRPLLAAVRAAPAVDGEAAASLSGKLAAFLDSPAVNDRTDDDKTLILATRRT